jgi:hypothetical protein
MNKRFILMIGFCFLVLSIGFVSAYSSYNDWYENYWKPAWSDSYSNSHYYKNNLKGNYYKDSVSYQRESEYFNQTRKGYERGKTSIIVTEEYESGYYDKNYNSKYDNYWNHNHRKNADYGYRDDEYEKHYSNNAWNYVNGNNYKKYSETYPKGDYVVYDTTNIGSYDKNCGYKTNWRYNPDNYQYGPKYDECLGYYNWRY